MFQQITSEKLKELFSSFKVMFPDVDSDSKSFAPYILKDDILKIEIAIGSLSKNVVLNTKEDIWKAEWPKAEARVVEVEVVYDGVEDQFFVSRKVSNDKVCFTHYYYDLYNTNKHETAFAKCNCISFYLGYLLRCFD